MAMPQVMEAHVLQPGSSNRREPLPSAEVRAAQRPSRGAGEQQPVGRRKRFEVLRKSVSESAGNSDPSP